MNPSFNLQASQINSESAQFFVEAGPMGFLMVVLDENNCFQAVVIYSFPVGLTEQELMEKLKEIFSSELLLQKQYHKTHIFWSFPDSLLVPTELMNADRNVNMLNLVFGDATPGITRSDFLYKHNLYNVYRIPESVAGIFSSHLPVTTQTHIFSTLVNRDFSEGNHLFAVFYSSSLTIMLCKEGKLQVIQNFSYQGPDDCVFHLLHVCKGFEVDADSVTLHISGLIDEQSGLYAALYKYFIRLAFDALPEGYSYLESIKDQPPHFFSHLFALASCV